MVELFSKKGFGFTYLNGRYEEYTSVRAVVYDSETSSIAILWNDGEWVENDTDVYISIKALDNGSIIEF